MAAAAQIRERTGIDVETLWGDDGFVVRFPDVDTPPDPRAAAAGPDEVQALVVRQLGRDGAVCREVPRERGAVAAAAEAASRHARAALAAAQARRRPARRRVALRIVPGPARDLSRVPARLLRHAGARRHARPTSAAARIRVVTVDSEKPSPFAASLLFSYVASFLYDGDAPLAERRAQALAVDQAQLRELMGDAELRELLDPDAVDDARTAAAAPRREVSRRTASTALHDMLHRARRPDDRRDRGAHRLARRRGEVLRTLTRARRVLTLRMAGEQRYVAVEDAARYRDGLGVPLPPGMPEALLASRQRSARRPRAAVCADARAVYRRPISRLAYGMSSRCGRSTCSCG